MRNSLIRGPPVLFIHTPQKDIIYLMKPALSLFFWFFFFCMLNITQTTENVENNRNQQTLNNEGFITKH